MKNEYGAPLDSNGYAPSIINGHGPHCCWRCGRNGTHDPLNRHEVFGGPFRQKSKRLGLWVYLCHDFCHQGNTGVHNDTELDNELRCVAQHAAMEAFGWTVEEFRLEFGKNYLEV